MSRSGEELERLRQAALKAAALTPEVPLPSYTESKATPVVGDDIALAMTLAKKSVKTDEIASLPALDLWETASSITGLQRRLAYDVCTRMFAAPPGDLKVVNGEWLLDEQDKRRQVVVDLVAGLAVLPPAPDRPSGQWLYMALTDESANMMRMKASSVHAHQILEGEWLSLTADRRIEAYAVPESERGHGFATITLPHLVWCGRAWERVYDQTTWSVWWTAL